MVIVGICGPSGSGKSTLSQGIIERFGGHARVIELDSYYRDNSALPFSQRATLNYDSPTIFDFDALVSDLRSLMAGAPITTKGYDYINHLRADSDALIYPPQVLLVEGIHTFYDDHLMELFDLTVYLSVDPDVCILRRLLRDVKERGRTMEDVIKQYLTTVKPMFEQYIRHYEHKADLSVPGGGQNQDSISSICDFLSARLKECNNSTEG